MANKKQMILGIDVGTQGVRCTCYDLLGGMLASFRSDYRVCFENGLIYASSRDIWSAVISVLRQSVDFPGIMPAALGVTAIIGTVFVDENLRVIEPALLWGDQRARDQCSTIPQEMIPATIGRELRPEHFLPRILWLREHAPDDFVRVAAVLTIKDWLVFKLTSTIACDEVSAGYYGCFNVRKGSWETNFLDSLNIDHSLFPPIRPAGSCAGLISQESCSQTGLPVECPVAVGGPDGSVGSFGAGAVYAGDCAIISGTTDVMTCITEEYIDVIGEGLIVNRSIVPGMFAITATLGQTGGSINALLQFFGITYDRGFERLQAKAGELDPGCDGVSVLGMCGGLRAPYWRPEAKIMISGVDTPCTQAHIYRALLENLSFAVNDCLAIVAQQQKKVKNIFLGGNGAQNLLWTQIRADIFALEIMIPAHLESSGFGSALLAAVAAGIYSDVTSAAENMITPPKTIEVDETKSTCYEGLYNRYRRGMAQYLNCSKTQAEA